MILCQTSIAVEIRNRYLNIRGTRGEIINDKLYYLNEDNIACTQNIDYKKSL